LALGGNFNSLLEEDPTEKILKIIDQTAQTIGRAVIPGYDKMKAAGDAALSGDIKGTALNGTMAAADVATAAMLGPVVGKVAAKLESLAGKVVGKVAGALGKKVDDTVAATASNGKTLANGSRTNWGPEHGTGNVKHNNAIEDSLDAAQKRGATDLAKSKAQRDTAGNIVGSKKPDAAYTENGIRVNENYVSNHRLNNNSELNRELNALKDMWRADPSATSSLQFHY
jgi:hypothetical protein